MEPTAPSLTEEDLTEVKKDVSSPTSPGRRGRGGARRPNGSWKGSLRVGEAAPQDRVEHCVPGTFVEVIPCDLFIHGLNR